MKVLVTGGAGFIGSHVVEELLHSQYEVVVIDNLKTGCYENLSKKVKLYELDVNDAHMEQVFKLEKPDYVMHLAAQASIMVSMSNPLLDLYTNTVGTLQLLLLSKKYYVKKFIFASTAAVYGEPSYLPVDEKHSLDPQSFYALSKQTAEKYIEFDAKNNELNYCILRYSNVYGPRQNTNGEAGVIPIFINKLLANEHVRIFDGSQTRDFIFVKDVAKACRLALESNRQGIFNISSCTETSVNDLYFLLTEEMGLSTVPLYEPLRVGEIKNSVLDNRRTRKELDWAIEFTLSEGLKETIHYYLELLMLKGQKITQ